MYRTLFLWFVAVLLLGTLTPWTSAQYKEIKPGEKYTGELVMDGNSIWADIPITLKAGQGISIDAVVVGDGRKVAVWLKDPTGKILDLNAVLEVKTFKREVKEVPASGKYLIYIQSNQIGRFYLWAKITGDDERGAAQVKAELLKARQDLRELETRIKILERELESLNRQ